MAELTLAGVTHVIAPFRLRELRRAAPYIDRLSARAGKLSSVEAVAETAADMLGALAAGMQGASLEALQAQAGLNDLDALRVAFEAVMAEAGLKRPEASAGDASAGAASVEVAPPGEGAAAPASVP